MMKLAALAFFCLFGVSLASVGEPSTERENDDPVTIQDNSFLVEEAYNQEPGVVQHASAFSRSWDTGEWVYAFTQEWPVPGQKHQLSFTLPIQSLELTQGADRGLGDLALNYRYQWVGDGKARVAVSPRFSLLLPTGNEQKGLGAGALGTQFNLPLSVVLSSRIVTHWNVGATRMAPHGNDLGESTATTGYNLGQGLIWLASPRVHLVLETVWDSVEAVVGPEAKERSHSLFINPGLRWSHNFKNGLQIVPGVAVPLGIGPSKGERGIFFYLSFEHYFSRQAGRLGR